MEFIAPHLSRVGALLLDVGGVLQPLRRHIAPRDGFVTSVPVRRPYPFFRGVAIAIVSQ